MWLLTNCDSGGTEALDTNQETVRLLRSQLRNKSSLRVIDAVVMPLMEVAQDQNKSANAARPDANEAAATVSAGNGGGTGANPANHARALGQSLMESRNRPLRLVSRPASCANCSSLKLCW